MHGNLRNSALLIAFSGALSLAACGGGDGEPAQMGTLGVSLTDSPACGFAEVNVTVNQVRVHSSSSAPMNGEGWSTIALNPPRKINLLELTNGVISSLGDTPLPAGHYTQVRLVLDRNTGSSTANSIVLSGTTTEIPLVTPSAAQSGIKLINAFDVMANQRTDLLLDFDACKSVVSRGNGSYGLKPVIRAIPFVLNGINGFVDPALLDAANSKNVRVSAQQNGAILRSTAPMPSSGQFVLGNLALGNYDVVIAADGHATVVIAGVPVTDATSTVPVSTQSEPIDPPISAAGTATISGTVTLNPANADVAAYVTAKQTLDPGPTVTVKSQPADQLDGSYLLALPKAAPLLGTYATPLPIALTDAAQGSVASQYKVEAAAEGYATQSADADISMANVTQNFVLVAP
jgi:hypothetical protein